MTRRIKMKCGCVVVAGEDGAAVYVIHCREGNQVREDCVFRREAFTSQEPIKKGELCDCDACLLKKQTKEIYKQVVEALDFCVGMIRDLALGNKNISQVPALPWNHIKKVLAAAKAGL